MKYITVKNFIIAIYHHNNEGAILQKSSIINKVVTKLLVYYLLYFKFAGILKQKIHLLCLLLLEKMAYRNIDPFIIFCIEGFVYCV